MGRIYTASFSGITELTGTHDIIEIVSASDSVCRLVGASFTQSSEAGDNQAEMGLMIVQRATSSGTGGVSVTAAPVSVADAAAGTTILHHNTSAATTLSPIIREAFNWQIGWFFTPTTYQEIEWGGSDILVFSLGIAPADAITSHGTFWFEEIG